MRVHIYIEATSSAVNGLDDVFSHKRVRHIILEIVLRDQAMLTPHVFIRRHT